MFPQFAATRRRRALLRTRPEIDPAADRAGGHSQAGWIFRTPRASWRRRHVPGADLRPRVHHRPGDYYSDLAGVGPDCPLEQVKQRCRLQGTARLRSRPRALQSLNTPGFGCSALTIAASRARPDRRNLASLLPPGILRVEDLRRPGPQHLARDVGRHRPLGLEVQMSTKTTQVPLSGLCDSACPPRRGDIEQVSPAVRRVDRLADGFGIEAVAIEVPVLEIERASVRPAPA